MLCVIFLGSHFDPETAEFGNKMCGVLNRVLCLIFYGIFSVFSLNVLENMQFCIYLNPSFFWSLHCLHLLPIAYNRIPVCGHFIISLCWICDKYMPLLCKVMLYVNQFPSHHVFLSLNTWWKFCLVVFTLYHASEVKLPSFIPLCFCCDCMNYLYDLTTVLCRFSIMHFHSPYFPHASMHILCWCHFFTVFII